MRDQLVIRLDEYSDTLLQHLQRFLDVEDRRGAEVIQRSCIACLAHLAAFCDLTSGLEPNSKPQMDAVCDSSLERLGHLSQDMRIDRYTYLDILLGVRPCITRADAEILTFGSSRGRSLWKSLIPVSTIRRPRRVRRCGVVGRLLHGCWRTLKRGSQIGTPRSSLHSWRIKMVGKRDRANRTFYRLWR